MSDEDIKSLILRGEKTAFILGKLTVSLQSFCDRCPCEELRSDICDAMSYLIVQCEDLFYSDFKQREVTQ